ncbi:MAG: hypothetical protein IJ336_07855 [Lachnospiraceae bacterium]|nr:hypothetical protein [Lachnospiraceae bacterium]MBQ7833472.1 hypothetical protein [Lachnospiraceae bacterium]
MEMVDLSDKTAKSYPHILFFYEKYVKNSCDIHKEGKNSYVNIQKITDSVNIGKNRCNIVKKPK